MIVSKETQNAVMELIGEAYRVNRKLDRAVSVLGVKFVCNKSADLIHHGMAHAFPELGDRLGEKCLERYNIPVVYAPTPAGDKDYTTATELIQDIESICIEFQTLMMGCCKVAFENNDIHVYADLLDMLEDVNEVVEQVMLLSDKITAFGEDKLMSFDGNISDYWILGGGD